MCGSLITQCPDVNSCFIFRLYTIYFNYIMLDDIMLDGCWIIFMFYRIVVSKKSKSCKFLPLSYFCLIQHFWGTNNLKDVHLSNKLWGFSSKNKLTSSILCKMNWMAMPVVEFLSQALSFLFLFFFLSL